MKRFILLAVFVCLPGLTGYSGNPPTDANLLSGFNANRADFANVAEMILADRKTQKVHLTYVRGASPAEARLKEYRDLLKKIGVQSVDRWDRQDENDQSLVEFTAFAGGAFPDDGIYKGIMYCPVRLPERFAGDVVPSLDAVDRRNVKEGTKLFQKIDDNWYLTFLY